MLAKCRPMMPRRVGAVAAAPWHSSQTESKISAPALTSPDMAVVAEPVAPDPVAPGGVWAIAFQARIALAAMGIVASKKRGLRGFLTWSIQFVPELIGIQCTY